MTNIRSRSERKGGRMHVYTAMLVVLSKLLRPIFSNWTLVWSLSEELKFTHHYIELVRMRYGDAITIQIEWDALTSDFQASEIPRFTLQPLLENCCEHGKSPDQALEIKIRFCRREDALAILVEDNGCGIPAETRDWLNARFSDPLSSPLPQMQKNMIHSNGIGMININRRLRLQYGERYGLRLSVPENGGTRVEIWLPL